MILDKWQKEILDCKAKNILLCKGRQIGGTFIFSRKCAMRLVSQPGCKIVVASITEDQAQLVIAMALAYLEEEHKKLIKRPYSRNVTKSVINLTTGSQIRSRPVGSTGNSVRGFTGHVLYLNEASRMPEFVFEAAKPILLTTAGDIWMDSTPFGIGTYFHKSFLNKNKRWKVFYHTSEEVIENRKISESWTKAQREGALRLLKEEKQDMTKLQYQQEYLGLFVGGIQRFFPDDLINSVCTIPLSSLEVGLIPAVPQGDIFQGIDIARMGSDETVLVSLKRNKDNLSQLDMEIPEGQTLTNTARLIINKDKKINHRKIYIDTGGMGIGVYDILFEDSQTRRKVVSLDNATRKIDKEKGQKNYRKRGIDRNHYYLNLRNLMENNKIKLFNSPELRQSLRSIQYENEEGVLKIYGNYTHIVEALIRAAWCSKDKSLNIWIKSIRV